MTPSIVSAYQSLVKAIQPTKLLFMALIETIDTV